MSNEIQLQLELNLAKCESITLGPGSVVRRPSCRRIKYDLRTGSDRTVTVVVKASRRELLARFALARECVRLHFQKKFG